MLPQHRRHKEEVCDHPLATQEWLALQVLQRMADPRAVCKLALINKNFCQASRSDFVWQKLLPPAAHLDVVLADMSEDARLRCQHITKRNLYFFLCTPISYEGGLKKFWLDPFTAGDCYIMSTRALSIRSMDACKHWKWKYCRNSWFAEVAYLHQEGLFNVCGRFQQLLRPGSYVVSFRMQLHSNSIWKGKRVRLCLQNSTYSHPPKEAHICFDNPHSLSYSMYQSPAPPHLEVEHSDRLPGWVECDAGEFTVEDENEGRLVEVTFSMEGVHWPQTRFSLDGVIIRPRFVVNNLSRERPKASSFESQACLRSFDEKYTDGYSHEDDEYQDDEYEDVYGDDSEDDYGDDSDDES